MPSAPFIPIPIGSAIPPHTPHAVSVSLPSWKATVGYEEGDPAIVSRMKCGYPRFFLHPLIVELSRVCEDHFANPEETCLLLPSRSVARRCQAFLDASSGPVPSRIVEWRVNPAIGPLDPEEEESLRPLTLFILLFPLAEWSIAKAYWQHTGEGISSRQAHHCLRLLTSLQEEDRWVSHVEQYPLGRLGNPAVDHPPLPSLVSSVQEQERFIDERFGRNMDLARADEAKTALRHRVARLASPTCSIEHTFLYPCGMAAIFHAHRLLRLVHPDRRSVCLGFPYTDTLKLLQKWGPGCIHLPRGDEADLSRLTQLLEDKKEPPILGVFCEFPSNPMLTSVDLTRVRHLADVHDFALVVDDTVGAGGANVEVLPWADMVVSSLTKAFSGDSNVMGGSLVINPRSPWAQVLLSLQEQEYEDLLWDEDAIFLERNSRSFHDRLTQINASTEALVDHLHATATNIYTLCYPKYSTPEVYARHSHRPHSPDLPGAPRGYGGLFSLVFHEQAQAICFFDALECAKGPSLGTNFTLACPYTLLAHYQERDWAEACGVPGHLIRISIGLEETSYLISVFSRALDASLK
ncbi:MAG: pyridoxal phosphate-dependent transferase [Piptocephalis tieghemiana]|nr:MAG: pyridoxal phosphate-dependent transferase [Piptocephalis tieghemiana]